MPATSAMEHGRTGTMRYVLLPRSFSVTSSGGTRHPASSPRCQTDRNHRARLCSQWTWRMSASATASRPRRGCLRWSRQEDGELGNEQAYSDPALSGILGDLRTPDGATVLGTNLTPVRRSDCCASGVAALPRPRWLDSMTDQELRTLRAKWKSTGDRTDGAAYLRGLVRSGSHDRGSTPGRGPLRSPWRSSRSRGG